MQRHPFHLVDGSPWPIRGAGNFTGTLLMFIVFSVALLACLLFCSYLGLFSSVVFAMGNAVSHTGADELVSQTGADELVTAVESLTIDTKDLLSGSTSITEATAALMDIPFKIDTSIGEIHTTSRTMMSGAAELAQTVIESNRAYFAIASAGSVTRAAIPVLMEAAGLTAGMGAAVGSAGAGIAAGVAFYYGPSVGKALEKSVAERVASIAIRKEAESAFGIPSSPTDGSSFDDYMSGGINLITSPNEQLMYDYYVILVFLLYVLFYLFNYWITTLFAKFWVGKLVDYLVQAGHNDTLLFRLATISLRGLSRAIESKWLWGIVIVAAYLTFLVLLYYLPSYIPLLHTLIND